MMVTANSRAAALGMPELSLRNYWSHQRWGVTGPKCSSAHSSRIDFIKKFNLPNQPPFLHVTQTNIQAVCMLEGDVVFLLGAMQGLHRAGYSMQDFLCHTISQHPSVKDSFVPEQMMRYTVSDTGWSVSSWKAQPVPVFESSQHQTPEKPCKMLPPGVHSTASCSNPNGSRACSSPFYSEGQQCCLH